MFGGVTMKFRKTRAEVIEGTIERLEKKLEQQEKERMFMGVSIRRTEDELEQWRSIMWKELSGSSGQETA